MSRRIFPTLVLLLTLPCAVAGESAEDRFGLFTHCGSLDLLVDDLDEETIAIGLSVEGIHVAMEKRLRSKGFHDKEADPYLYVRVIVFEDAYSADVEFYKRLFDPDSESVDWAATWYTGSIGTHGSDPDYIMSDLSELMDEFLAEYLRVNKPACK